MSLKDEYLFLAISCLLSIFFDGLMLLLYLIICVTLFYHRNKYQHKQFIIALILFILLPTKNGEATPQMVLEVENIKTNYVIASNGDFTCILYNIEGVNINDVIEVEGDYSDINTNQNFNLFNFKDYMMHQGIRKSMYVLEYKIIEKSTSLKSKVYNQFKNKPLHEVYLAYFYGIAENDDLIVSSGFHFVFLISLIAKRCKANRQLVTLLFCLSFALFFPVKTSVLRMFIFAFVHCISKSTKYDKLGISILILLSFNKYLVYEVGFILPVLFSFCFLFNIQKIPARIVSFFIVVGVQLFYFNEANLFTILCFSLLRQWNGMLFLLVILSLIVPFLGWLILFLMQCIQIFANFKIPYLYMRGSFSLVSLLVYPYCFVMLISTNNKKYYSYMFLLLCYQANLKVCTPYGEVSVLDVGQGDCILIREPFNGDVMLIDTGGNVNYDIAENIVYPVLKSKGIKAIDIVLITHDDYDHSGALESLQELIHIEEVITTKEDIHLSNISFNAFQSKEALDTNDASIMLFSEINGLRYLFCGDASTSIEEAFIEQYNKLKIDILKVGHHGSKTSSSNEFLMKIQPLYAFISSGKNNFYNHPSPEVIERFEERQIDVYDTQDVGNISVIYTPFFNLLHTGDKTFGIIKKVIK